MPYNNGEWLALEQMHVNMLVPFHTAVAKVLIAEVQGVA